MVSSFLAAKTSNEIIEFSASLVASNARVWSAQRCLRLNNLVLWERFPRHSVFVGGPFILAGTHACWTKRATCLTSALWFKGCIYCKKHRWQFGPWPWIPLCTLPVVVFSQKLCGGTTRHFPSFGKKSTPIGHGVGFARTKIIRHKRPTQTMENVSNTASRTTAELAQDLHPQVDALAASNFYFIYFVRQMACRHYRVDALTSGHVNYLNSPHRPEDRQQKRSERLYLFSSRHSSMKHWDLELFYRTHFAMHNSKDVGPKHGPNSLNQAGNNRRQPGAPPFDWRSPVIFCNHRQDWKMSYNSRSTNYAIVGKYPPATLKVTCKKTRIPQKCTAQSLRIPRFDLYFWTTILPIHRFLYLKYICFVLCRRALRLQCM